MAIRNLFFSIVLTVIFLNDAIGQCYAYGASRNTPDFTNTALYLNYGPGDSWNYYRLVKQDVGSVMGVSIPMYFVKWKWNAIAVDLNGKNGITYAVLFTTDFIQQENIIPSAEKAIVKTWDPWNGTREIDVSAHSTRIGNPLFYYRNRVIMAHELGHILQYEFGYGQHTPSRKQMELHADFMAGFYLKMIKYRDQLAWRVDNDVINKLPDAIDLIHSVGDYKVYSDDHHGTPNERVRAFSYGFSMEPNSIGPYAVQSISNGPDGLMGTKDDIYDYEVQHPYFGTDDKTMVYPWSAHVKRKSDGRIVFAAHEFYQIGLEWVLQEF